jgi:hypothetical protein
MYSRLILASAGSLLLSFIACERVTGQGAAANANREIVARRMAAVNGQPAFDHHIVVDQFGYRPHDAKFAVIRSPEVGFDANDKFSPGQKYELRRAIDGTVVYAGAPSAWNVGKVDNSAGDRGWWFDFSSVSAEGRFFVVDADKKVRSAEFAIAQDVYLPILKSAMRMYFYQRSGFDKKREPWADSCWADAPAYIGPNQDRAARDITDPENTAKVRDLSGGWFDAGDTNKYVKNAVQPVHQLLTAFQLHPGAFGDDFNIPESGNGIPDVIDEVKWEIDWLKKMQFEDGSVALKVGAASLAPASPPSSDRSPRYYVPSCTSSTIAAAGMFAHAAYVFGGIPALAADGEELKRRAVKAWDSYQRAPVKQTQCDSGRVLIPGSDLSVPEQNAFAAQAAIYLLAVTHDKVLDQYVREHYRELKPYSDMGWSRYNPEQGDALLFYTTVSEANAGLKATILDDKRKDIMSRNGTYELSPRDDLYRAFVHGPQYHWGSNAPRANYGNSNVDILMYDLKVGNVQPYRERALGLLHYFHGVNPFAMVYLTNMYANGATVSVNQTFHAWFQPRTKWSDALNSECGPAPGYVTAGPNAHAVENGMPANLLPPANQPLQKSYRDWNDNSWAVTEAGIYYQSAYVKLVAAFAQ